MEGRQIRGIYTQSCYLGSTLVRDTKYSLRDACMWSCELIC